MADNTSEIPLRRMPRGVSGSTLQRVMTDAGSLWLPVKDDVIREYMLHAKTWEPEVGHVLLQCIPRTDGLFVDIGAHVGYFSRLVAHGAPGCEIHAFEPNPKIYPILELNAWPAEGRITTWPCALYSETIVLPLREIAGNTGDTRDDVITDGMRTDVLVPATMLDRVLPDANITTVKIDVQGAELDVLQGMVGTIRRCRTIKIVMEFSPGLLHSRSIEPVSLLTLIRSFDFTIAVINGDRVYDVTDDELLAFLPGDGQDRNINTLLYRKSSL